jgi:hypothetical protein
VTPQETDNQISSSEDDKSVTEYKSEVSFDIRSHPRRDDNINNLQPTDETSAIYRDQGMADGYDVEEHSSQDYANEEGYDSANYDETQSTRHRPTTANIKVIIMIMMMKLDP